MDRVGKYQIVEQIGAGGFSEVFKGFDPHLKRSVAIKICTARDPELRSRFFQEAEIAGHLQHRNIVTVFDFGLEDEVPYLVQEYLTGEDLDKKVKRGDRLPHGEMLEILKQVALGLAHAHQQGIIHRDIKPGNVRVLEDGSAKIMDFGIAKFLQQDTGLTKTGMTVGTAAYLAPEQIRGRPAGPQTDVFSFGVLAYELLTLVRPFAGEQISAVLYQIVNDSPRQLTAKAPDCPPALADLVMRCLAKDAGNRPADGSVLVAALESIGRAQSRDSEEVGELPVTQVLPRIEGTDGVADWELRAETTPLGRKGARKAGSSVARAARRKRRRWPWIAAVAVTLLAAASYWLPHSGLLDAIDISGAVPAFPSPSIAEPSGAEGSVTEDSPHGSRRPPDGQAAGRDAMEATATTAEKTQPTAQAPPPPPPQGVVILAPAWDPTITVAVDKGRPRRLNSPLRIPLTPGDHTLRFVVDLEGYRAVTSLELEAVAGVEKHLALPLPPPGSLVVQTRPGSLEGMVRLGGEDMGTGLRVTIPLLRPGDYELEIVPVRAMPKAKTTRLTVTVGSREDTIVTYDLEGDSEPTVRQKIQGAAAS